MTPVRRMLRAFEDGLLGVLDVLRHVGKVGRLDGRSVQGYPWSRVSMLGASNVRSVWLFMLLSFPRYKFGHQRALRRVLLNAISPVRSMRVRISSTSRRGGVSRP